MRRSLAPTQLHRQNINEDSGKTELVQKDIKCNEPNMLEIRRMPLFDFLHIPESLNRQFKVPTGCVITEKYVL